MDRDALADFLRRRRAALTPVDVGLPAGARRRTPGLRREEVAQLAHMSADFYTRLEQARGSRPSQQTIAALARALCLTPDERDHLHRIAGYTAPPRSYRSDHPSPGLQRILGLLDTPAQIITDIGVTLEQNRLARALVGSSAGYTGLQRSLVYRWFTDPATRDLHPADEHDLHAHAHVATLRDALGRNPEDPEVRELVQALVGCSPEFVQLWELHEVASRRTTLKRFIHPELGIITLDCQILVSENAIERLVVFTAPPGSEDADKLKLLQVIGSQVF